MQSNLIVVFRLLIPIIFLACFLCIPSHKLTPHFREIVIALPAFDFFTLLTLFIAKRRDSRLSLRNESIQALFFIVLCLLFLLHLTLHLGMVLLLAALLSWIGFRCWYLHQHLEHQIIPRYIVIAVGIVTFHILLTNPDRNWMSLAINSISAFLLFFLSGATPQPQLWLPQVALILTPVSIRHGFPLAAALLVIGIASFIWRYSRRLSWLMIAIAISSLSIFLSVKGTSFDLFWIILGLLLLVFIRLQNSYQYIFTRFSLLLLSILVIILVFLDSVSDNAPFQQYISQLLHAHEIQPIISGIMILGTALLASVITWKFKRFTLGLTFILFIGTLYLLSTNPERMAIKPPSGVLLDATNRIYNVSLPEPMEADTIILAATAENAYGLIENQRVVKIQLMNEIIEIGSFVLKAGNEIGESGYEMPLVRDDLRHTKAPVAFWKLNWAERGEFLYRSLWYRARLNLQRQEEITNIIFENMLPEQIKVKVSIAEIILFKR